MSDGQWTGEKAFPKAREKSVDAMEVQEMPARMEALGGTRDPASAAPAPRTAPAEASCV